MEIVDGRVTFVPVKVERNHCASAATGERQQSAVRRRRIRPLV
jgi:hypothetical protein